MENGDTKALQGQIDSLKAELALRSESTKELLNTKINSAEKVFNTKNDSTERRITIYSASIGLIFTIMIAVFTLIGTGTIVDWAERNVGKFVDIKYKKRLDSFEKKLDDKLDKLGVNLDFMDWYKIGELQYENREYASATKSFTHAISMKPDHVYANGVRGMSYYYLFKFKKAIKDLDKAIDIKPDYAIAFGFKGYAHYSLKEYVTAFKNINKETDLFIKRDDFERAERGIRKTLSKLDKVQIDEKFSKEMKKAIKGDIEQLEKQLEDARNKKELFRKETRK